MEVRGFMRMEGEGESGLWFLARKSGRKRSDIAPLGSLETSLGRPLRAWTSLHLLPEARAMRNVVFMVKCLREEDLNGS